MNAITPEAFVFETERLRMRPLAPRDEALYCELYTDPETMRFIGPPMTMEKAATSFQQTLARAGEDGVARLFVITHKRSERDIGVSAIRPAPAKRRAEFGIVLSREGRGRGHALQALSSTVDVAFSTFPIDYVWVQYAPDNAAADRIAKYFGFIACLDGRIRIKNSNNCIFTMSRDAWFDYDHNVTKERSKHV